MQPNGRPEDILAMARRAFKNGQISKALGYLELGAMCFPERRSMWRAKWCQIKGLSAIQRDQEAKR